MGGQSHRERDVCRLVGYMGRKGLSRDGVYDECTVIKNSREKNRSTPASERREGSRKLVTLVL